MKGPEHELLLLLLILQSDNVGTFSVVSRDDLIVDFWYNIFKVITCLLVCN